LSCPLLQFRFCCGSPGSVSWQVCNPSGTKSPGSNHAQSQSQHVIHAPCARSMMYLLPPAPVTSTQYPDSPEDRSSRSNQYRCTTRLAASTACADTASQKSKYTQRQPITRVRMLLASSTALHELVAGKCFCHPIV
jgi:hypothetical protein